MDCHHLESRLEALLGDQLSERRRQECLRHAERCAECGELLRLAGLTPAAGPKPVAISGPPPGLVEAVLAATSGPVCATTRERLCARLDGQLPAVDTRLVDAHCATCEECSATAWVLAACAEELPRLAEMLPDAAFVADVLARTLPVEVRLRRWWQSSWSRWVQRPRFAWEAAYAATLALVLITSAFGSPLESMPGSVVQWGRSVPWNQLEQPATRLEASVVDRLRSTWQAAGAPVVDASRTQTSEFARLGRRTWTRMQADMGTVGGELASLLKKADDSALSVPDEIQEEN